MPVYEYICEKEDCQHEFDLLKSFDQCCDPELCPVCGGSTKKRISRVYFVLKGDNWAGKAEKIKSQMKEKNRKLDAKQKDLPTTTLVPNVDGERVDSWSEAKKLAASKGKISETYEPLVEKEARTKKR